MYRRIWIFALFIFIVVSAFRGQLIFAGGNAVISYPNYALERLYGKTVSDQIQAIVTVPYGVTLGDMWNDLKPETIDKLRFIGIDKPVEWLDYNQFALSSPAIYQEKNLWGFRLRGPLVMFIFLFGFGL